MKIEDVRVGMKVVPHDKTAGSTRKGFDDWKDNNFNGRNDCCVKFLDEHGFLSVSRIENGIVWLSCGVDAGWRFNASDFEPATIEVGDEVRVSAKNHGGYALDSSDVEKTHIALYPGQLLGGFKIQFNPGRRLYFFRNELDLVRKAHCIKPEAVEEAEPKAPETVRLAWVRFCATNDMRLYKVPNGAEVKKGDTVLAPPKGVKLRGVVDEVRTVSKADAAFMLRGQQPMVVPFLVGKVVTETKEVLFDD